MVVLPEPVGPVARIIPKALNSSVNFLRSSSKTQLLERELVGLTGKQTEHRFSPKVVGITETRTSTLPCREENSNVRPASFVLVNAHSSQNFQAGYKLSMHLGP